MTSQSLQWTRPLLDELFEEVRQAVEKRGDEDAERSSEELNGAIEACDKVAGSLAVMDFHSGQLIAEAMGLALEALASDQVKDANKAIATLLEATAILPDYLDYLESTQRDAPIVVLPTINDLRAAAGARLLEESKFFQPELESAELPAPEGEHDDSPTGLRRDYQHALRGFLMNNQDAEATETLAGIGVRVRDLTALPVPVRRAGWASAGVSEALGAGQIAGGPAITRLYARMDVILKEAAEASDGEALAEKADDLTRGFLFQIAVARAETPRVEEVSLAFDLESQKPDQLEQARIFLSGHNRALFSAVTQAAREDLAKIKEVLGSQLEQSNDPEILAQQTALLESVGESLGMLGLDHLARRVSTQAGKLSELNNDPDDPTLLMVARELLVVESQLEESFGTAAASEEEDEADGEGTLLPPSEQRRVTRQLVKEVLDDLAHAKHLLDAINRQKADASAVEEAQSTLTRIAGALHMAQLDECARMLEAAGTIVADHLGDGAAGADSQTLETLAETLTVTEFYLESLTSRDEHGARYLDSAIQRLQALGYWDEQADTEPAAPDEAAPEPAELEPEASGEAPEPVEDTTPESVPPVADSDDVAEDEDTEDFDLSEFGDFADFDETATADTASASFDAPADAPTDAPAESDDDEAGSTDAVSTEPGDASPAEPAAPSPAEASADHEASAFDDFDIVEIFLEEFDQELETLNELVPEWQADPSDEDRTTTIRRAFHSLKGSGRMAGANEIGEFSWQVENMLNRILDGQLEPTPAVTGLVAEALTALPSMRARLSGEGEATMDEAACSAIAEKATLASDGRLDELETTEPERPPELEGLDPTLIDLMVKELSENLEIFEAQVSEALERGKADPVDDRMVRAVHTMKGTMRLAPIGDEAETAQILEAYLEELSMSSAPPSEDGQQAMSRCADLFRQRLDRLCGQSVDDERFSNSGLTEDLRQLHNLAHRDRTGETPPAIESRSRTMQPDEADSVDTSATDETGLPASEAPADRAFDEPSPFAEAAATSDAATDEPDFSSDSDSDSGFESTDSDDDFFDLDSFEAETPATTDAHEAGTEPTIDEGEETPGETLPEAEQLPEHAETDDEPAEATEGDAPLFGDEPVFGSDEATDEGTEAAQDDDSSFEFETDAYERPEADQDTERDAELADAESRPETALEDTAFEVPSDETSDTADETDQPEPEEAETADLGADEEALPETEESDLEQVVESDFVPDAPRASEADSPAEEAEAATGAEEVIEVNYDEVSEDLLEAFLEEGQELLEHSDGLLQRWREEPDDKSLVTGLQRNLHTIKGSSRMVGLNPIGQVAHVMEELLEGIAAGLKETNNARIDALESGCDHLHAMIDAVNERRPMPKRSVEELFAEQAEEVEEATELAAELATESIEEPEPVETEQSEAGRAENLRVPATLIDELVNYAGEISIFRSRLEQQVSVFRNNVGEVDETVIRLRDQLRKLEIETEAQILARYEREHGPADEEFDPLELDRYSTIQQLSRALGESVNDLTSLTGILDDATRQSETLLMQQSRVNTELQEGLMQARLVSFNTLLPRLRRVVRNAAREVEKKAQLTVKLEGEGELDRNVLDRITAPLEHLLRNAVSHGIETPEQRQALGKPETGAIRIDVTREATELVMRIHDDGGGLDLEAIRSKAVSAGLLGPNDRPDDQALAQMIFRSGFSTAEQVSELAGRGIGMDVVANEVRQIGGSVAARSQSGSGAHFTIRIPLSLTIMQAIMVRASDRHFAIPLQAVRGVTRILAEEWQRQIESTDPHQDYAGESYPLLELEPQLDFPAEEVGSSTLSLLMIEAGEERAALRVSELLGHREIVIKPVGPQISSIPGILGGTITGDGQVVSILDMGPLIRRAFEREIIPGQARESTEARAEVKRTPLVMVVDDSITMRRVTGRVLEHRGLEVVTARDGLDAVESMFERVPDLILLDIEMPRMDGYELATHVRNDMRLKEVPMIMITSRSGEKHRQHARELGVNDYLTKPYQEGDLIEHVFAQLNMPVPQG